jgi:hypothetical protein
MDAPPNPPWPGAGAKRVGVVPAGAARPIARLLDCLQEIFPVSFERREEGRLDGLDAILALGPSAAAEALDGPPALLAPYPGSLAARGAQVSFGTGARIARPLRGRVLFEERGPAAPPGQPRPGDASLATAAGAVAWWHRRRADGNSAVRFSAYAPEELTEGQTLRDHLREGRFMGLVPLLHLLEEVCGEAAWTRPPLRACFVIDDPNLHWTSYGFIDYAELASHAARHGYHVTLAMVPLDGALVSRRAAQLVKSSAGRLSLLVHGNDHVARELGRLSSASEAERVIAQALRRVARFERRAGVGVARVMAPPHGACSRAAAEALLALAFEAVFASRPYPWQEELAAPSPLAGWHPAELVAGGLPVLPRHHLAARREELIFRALLGQPQILYLHHWDLRGGLDVLARAARDVDSLGDVRWGRPDWIAKGSFSSRLDGGLMEVELHSRDVVVELPAGVRALRVRTRGPYDEHAWEGLAWSREGASAPSLTPLAADGGGFAAELDGVRGPARLRLRLPPRREPGAAQPPRRGPRPWPLARRLLVEGRDRAWPALAGLRRPRAGAGATRAAR